MREKKERQTQTQLSFLLFGVLVCRSMSSSPVKKTPQVALSLRAVKMAGLMAKKQEKEEIKKKRKKETKREEVEDVLEKQTTSEAEKIRQRNKSRQAVQQAAMEQMRLAEKRQAQKRQLQRERHAELALETEKAPAPGGKLLSEAERKILADIDQRALQNRLDSLDDVDPILHKLSLLSILPSIATHLRALYR